MRRSLFSLALGAALLAGGLAGRPAGAAPITKDTFGSVSCRLDNKFITLDQLLGTKERETLAAFRQAFAKLSDDDIQAELARLAKSLSPADIEAAASWVAKGRATPEQHLWMQELTVLARALGPVLAAAGASDNVAADLGLNLNEYYDLDAIETALAAGQAAGDTIAAGWLAQARRQSTVAEHYFAKAVVAHELLSGACEHGRYAALVGAPDGRQSGLAQYDFDHFVGSAASLGQALGAAADDGGALSEARWQTVCRWLNAAGVETDRHQVAPETLDASAYPLGRLFSPDWDRCRLLAPDPSGQPVAPAATAPGRPLAAYALAASDWLPDTEIQVYGRPISARAEAEALLANGGVALLQAGQTVVFVKRASPTNLLDESLQARPHLQDLVMEGARLAMQGDQEGLKQLRGWVATQDLPKAKTDGVRRRLQAILDRLDQALAQPPAPR